MNCANCNQTVSSDDKFCPHCGHEKNASFNQKVNNPAKTISSTGNYSGTMIKSKSSQTRKIIRNIIIGLILAGFIAIIIWLIVDPTAKEKLVNAIFGIVFIGVFVFVIWRKAKKGKIRKSSDNYDYDSDNDGIDDDYDDD